LKGGDLESSSIREAETFLMDKVLLEFPVFSLNEDYLRALANVVQSKLDSIRNLIKQKNKIVASHLEHQPSSVDDKNINQ